MYGSISKVKAKRKSNLHLQKKKPDSSKDWPSWQGRGRGCHQALSGNSAVQGFHDEPLQKRAISWAWAMAEQPAHVILFLRRVHGGLHVLIV